jgi:FkbM family methyltransferase
VQGTTLDLIADHRYDSYTIKAWLSAARKEKCMRITINDLYRRLNSAPVYRRFGVPTSSKNGAIVAFHDEAHFHRAKYILEGHQVTPVVTIFDTELKAQDLSARLGTQVLGFDFATRQPHKDFLICAHEAPRPAVMKMVMRTWRNGHEQYFISQSEGAKARPFFVEQEKDRILEIVNRLCDDESVEYFVARVKAITMGDSGYLRMSPYWQYAHPIVRAEAGEVVCDGGIGTSPNTPINFSRFVGEKGRVYGFEPIQTMYKALKAKTASYANIEMVPKGLWSKEEQIKMFVAGDVSTFRELAYTDSQNVETCDLTTIDSFFEKAGRRPNLVKLDIEGAEQKALAGAESTIRDAHPKLQICLYHTVEDLLEIPLQILRYWNAYKLYVGHHTPFFNECVLYAHPAL